MNIMKKVKAEFGARFIFLNPHTACIRARIIELMNTPGMTGHKDAEDFVCQHPHGAIEIFSAQLESI